MGQVNIQAFCYLHMHLGYASMILHPLIIMHYENLYMLNWLQCFPTIILLHTHALGQEASLTSFSIMHAKYKMYILHWRKTLSTL